MTHRKPLQSACKNFEEDLVLYYYGEVGDDERRRVNQHLAECIPCQGFVDDLRRLLPQMARSGEMPAPFWDQYYRETLAKLAQQEARKHWWRTLFAPRQVWMVPAFGTVAVAVLVIGLLFGKGNLNSLVHRTSEVIPQEILADENQLQFFESMDLIESLDNLQKQDDQTGDSTSTQSSRPMLQQGVA
jgi:Putative zinc-finger